MEDVNSYPTQVPEPQRAELLKIRETVKRLVPDAEEFISYIMPEITVKTISL